jgi:hypothetical protein
VIVARFGLRFALHFALRFGLHFGLRFAPVADDHGAITDRHWHRGWSLSLTCIPVRGSTA